MLKKILILFALVFTINNAIAVTSNVGAGDIGDFGTWATPHNQELFVNGLTDDITSFQNQLQTNIQVKNYVPIEARVGRAFIGGLSMISSMLERSLFRFATIFMVVLFMFWASFETYQMIRATQDTKKLLEEIGKKLLFITIWIFLIEQGPAQLFMWIMGPLITIAGQLSDLILNAVANASGASLPDTCAAIHNYITANPTGAQIIDSTQTANLLCVPTRLSGFFYTAISAGFKWMLAGIGHSALTFTAGAVFVVLFIYNAWKFALMAFGVIADLFLALIMLPFTAIAETFGGTKTSYDGYAGAIFNEFVGLFKTESLSAQIQKFISAAIYFVSLSIVIAVCAALLSGVIDTNLASSVPTLESSDFMSILIVGCLVAYLATTSGDIAKKIAGSINDGIGTQVGGDIAKLWGNTSKQVQNWWKIIRKK